MIFGYFIVVYLMGMVYCNNKIMVFYDCMDQASQDFFTKQLGHPTINEDNFNFVFIPYGNTKMTKITDDSYEFVCEKGPIHCDLLMLHATIVISVDYPYNFTKCLMELKPTIIENMIKECGKPSDQIDNLIKIYRDSAEIRLAYFGNVTHNHRITRFPTVFINDERLDDFQYEIIHNFKTFIEVYNTCRLNVHTVDTVCLMEHFPKSSAALISSYSAICLLLLIQTFMFFI